MDMEILQQQHHKVNLKYEKHAVDATQIRPNYNPF